MPIYKIKIAYDGTDYFGWQIQKDKKTIVHTLQKTFEQVFKKNIRILGASRTDAGVHAQEQVARFETDLIIQPRNMLYGWNNSLPNDIVIKDLIVVDDSFHPFRLVKQKTYTYQIFMNRPLPFCQRYGWFISQPLNTQKLKQALEIFVGTHDFTRFSSSPGKNNNIRTIDAIALTTNDQINSLIITVKGQGFLHHMIRRIIGAAVFVTISENHSIATLKDALQGGLQSHFLPTAPAKGLTLQRIEY